MFGKDALIVVDDNLEPLKDDVGKGSQNLVRSPRIYRHHSLRAMKLGRPVVLDGRDQTRHLLGPETRLEVAVAALLCDSFENWQVQDLGIRGIVGLAEALVVVDLLKHLLLGDCVEGPKTVAGRSCCWPAGLVTN